MRTLLKIGAAVAVCAISALSAEAQGVTVYNNLDSNYIAPFSGGGVQYGDQVIINGASCKITQFQFEYWANAAASADVKIYKNDGALVNGSQAPGTLLFDSGSFAIGATTGGKILTFDSAALNGGFDVPETFTWTVTFSGIPQGSDAGLSVYGAPTVGNGYTDYWVNNNELRILNGSFGAKFDGTNLVPVPEPGTFALLGLGGVVVMMFRRRK